MIKIVAVFLVYLRAGGCMIEYAGKIHRNDKATSAYKQKGEKDMAQLIEITDKGGVTSYVNTEEIVTVTPNSEGAWTLLLRDRLSYSIDSIQVADILEYMIGRTFLSSDIEEKRQESMEILSGDNANDADEDIW